MSRKKREYIKNEGTNGISKSLKGSETEKNLFRTFAGESRACVKYTLFAERAKLEGYQWLAEEFHNTSLNELAHARAAYSMFLGLVGTTVNNLKDAIAGETEEFTNIYKGFMETAEKEGYPEVATFYKELMEVEEEHSKNFKWLFDKLKAETIFKGNKDTKWYCMNCGYIYEGSEAPEVCPLCKFPRGYFKEYCDETSL